MDFGAATHTGYVRSGNEDGFFASRELAVFAVADGMGGHAHGEVASHLALEAIADHATILSQANPGELANDLHDTVQAANTSILSQAEAQDTRNRMGTTLVLATICGDRLYFAHIGDSRLYLLRGDVFTQLTRDHSLVQAMVDRGEISPEEAAIHPLRHQITRVVGGDNRVSPEIASQALEVGDIILLCTDGLSGAVSAETIKAALGSDATAQEKADALIQAALESGGPDNVTVVVVSYQRPHYAPKTPRADASHRHLAPWLIVLLTLLGVLFVAAALAGWTYTHPDYTVTTDARNTLGLYKSWRLLSFLPRERILIPTQPEITLTEARPYLLKYKSVEDGTHSGIHVQGKDAGVAMLNELTQGIASKLLTDAKTALEHGEMIQARTDLARAKLLHADPQMTAQIEAQLALKTPKR